VVVEIIRRQILAFLVYFGIRSSLVFAARLSPTLRNSN
jgi:hypothetical protein